MNEVDVDGVETQDDLSLTEEDLAVLNEVEASLQAGIELKSWFDSAEASEEYGECFELSRTHNRPDTSFGFLSETRVGARDLPIMGNVQSMFYDRPKTPRTSTPGKPKKPTGDEPLSVENYPLWLCDQVREFVLHYFMRTSDFRQPDAYPETNGDKTPPDYLRPLSWQPERREERGGFGFSQLYFKRADNGEIGKFSEEDRSAIVDLREIGDTYDWIVVKVNIFDFKFKVAPMGAGGPHMVVPMGEASYLAISREFVCNDDNPPDDDLGRYGLGYVFVKDPKESVLGYGPGHFDAAFQTIDFHVRENGEVHSRMAFVANRPDKILNVSVDPVNWSLRMADMMSFGAASSLTSPVRSAWERMPRPGGVDLASAYIQLADLVSGGMSKSELSISKLQLEKNFLLQHFTQHYNAIAGSSFTWRLIPDWLDRDALPEWVVTGRSS